MMVSARLSRWTFKPMGSTPMMATSAKAMTASAMAISIIVKPRWPERPGRGELRELSRIRGRDALPRVQANRQAGPARFVESLHDSSIAHWGHEQRLLARSPGFSRPDVLPPEGGTPCNIPFMESSLFLSDLPTGHEPKNCKCLEINDAIFRFMERANPAHSRPRTAALW